MKEPTGDPQTVEQRIESVRRRLGILIKGSPTWTQQDIINLTPAKQN